MTKKSVHGIESVKDMESSGNFDADKIVEVLITNKDIIRKVETGKDHIDVYLNLRASRQRLVDGIAEMYKKFDACTVDLECDKGIRVLSFWWDSSDREI